MLDGTYTFHHALIGGVLIGLASFLATFSTGKTPGISGVCARLLVPATPDKPWCFIFLVGLIVGAGSAFHFLALAAIYRPQSTAIITAVAGLLVGVWEVAAPADTESVASAGRWLDFAPARHWPISLPCALRH